MKNDRKITMTRCLLTASAAVILAGCASAPAPEAVESLSMDAALTEQVRSEVRQAVPAASIDVRSSQGKVALSGPVPDAETARQAVRSALAVEGVRGVVNEMQISGDGESGGVTQAGEPLAAAH